MGSRSRRTTTPSSSSPVETRFSRASSSSAPSSNDELERFFGRHFWARRHSGTRATDARDDDGSFDDRVDDRDVRDELAVEVRDFADWPREPGDLGTSFKRLLAFMMDDALAD